jgi:predicted permease
MSQRFDRLVRSLTGRSRFEAELGDELRDHLERRTADLVRAGLPPDEARRRARIEFGGLEAYKEQIRDGSRWGRWRNLPEQLGRELRFALRRLVAAPVFTLFAVLSLAVGVGVTTAFYSVMYPLLWPATGLRDSQELAYLMVRQQTDIHPSDWAFTISRGDLEELRKSQQNFAGVAAWMPFGMPLIDGDVATEVRGEAVTGNAFEVLGARMARGRPILPADDEPGAPAVVVLDHALWKASFGGDPGVVGRTIRIGGQPVEVVGIAAATFHGAQQPYFIGGPQMWMPFTAAARLSRSVRAVVDPANHESRWLSAVGRLRPGRSVEQASAELGGIGRQLDQAFPVKRRYEREPVNAAGFTPRRWSAARVDLALADAFRPNARMLMVLLVLVALVLAVACTNLANLMLARGSARQHEFAVRRALGCSRGRLVREQLVESAVLAVLGGAAGLLVARTLLVTLSSQASLGPGLTVETDLLPGVLAAAFVALLFTLLVFGLGPRPPAQPNHPAIDPRERQRHHRHHPLAKTPRADRRAGRRVRGLLPRRGDVRAEPRRPHAPGHRCGPGPHRDRAGELQPGPMGRDARPAGHRSHRSIGAGGCAGRGGRGVCRSAVRHRDRTN